MQIQSIADDVVAMSNIKTLRQEREKRGLTQLELSEKIGISSQPVISAIELMERCNVSDYNKLADFFGWERYVPCRKTSSSNSANEELMLPFTNETKKTFKRRRKQRQYSNSETYSGIKKELHSELSLLASLQETTVTDIINKLVTAYLAKHRGLIESVKALREQYRTGGKE